MKILLKSTISIEAVIVELNKIRAKDLLHDIDRQAVGFKSLYKREKEYCKLLSIGNYAGLYYFEIDCSVPTWVDELLSVCKHSVIHCPSPPQEIKSRLGMGVIYNITLSHPVTEDLAKKWVDLEYRLDQRTLDLCFAVFMRKTGAKLSASNLEFQTKLYDHWLSTPDGQNCYKNLYEFAKKYIH